MNEAPAKPSRAFRQRRWLWLLVAIAGVGSVVGLVGTSGYRVWYRATAPAPPEPVLDGADPAVAAAIHAAQARVRRSPWNGSAWGELAMILLAHELAVGVTDCLEQAEKLDPRNPRWPYLHAIALVREQGDAEAAIPLIERAIERCGSVQAPRLRLGELLLDLNRLDAAEREFRIAIEADSKDARAHLGLGRVAHARGNLETSRDHLRRSAERAPEVRATYILLAEVAHRLGDAEAAADALDRAEAITHPVDWPDPYLIEMAERGVGVLASIDNATSLLRHGASDDAVSLLRRTIRDYPDSHPAHLALGRLLMRIQKPTEAEVVLRRAVRLAPESVETEFELALALQTQGKNLDAIEQYRHIVERKPNHAFAHFNLGKALESNGDWPDAVEAYRAAIRYMPDYAPGYANLGALLATMGQDAEAVEHLQRALQLRPSDARSQKLLDEIRRRINPK